MSWYMESPPAGVGRNEAGAETKSAGTMAGALPILLRPKR